MDLNVFFKKDLIVLDKSFESKEEALKFLASNLVDKNYAKNADTVFQLALKREKEFSTGIGGSIAIPHIRDEVMNESVITFAKISPLNWNSVDNVDVKYVFFISLRNSDVHGSHMEIIAQLSSLFLDSDFINQLQNVSDYESLMSLMNKKLDDNKKNQESQIQISDTNYDIVAVTACPTGIAHTFMARDMLMKAAKEMSVKIKVETQGAEGIKNKLTQEEINNAKGVIIAVDRTIDLSKFAGHNNVLELGTKAVIKNAKKELTRSLNSEGYKFEGKKKTLSNENDDINQISLNKFGKRMYKSLMTGVSYMLPFVVFGGILIALAFLIDIKNSGDTNGNYGTINPVAKWFKELGGLSFGMMVPILAAYITYAIVGRMGLLPGFVVGLVAKGDFFFQLNPKTGAINWLEKPGNVGATSGVFGAIMGAFIASFVLILLIKYIFAYIPQQLSGIKNILVIPLIGTFVVASVFWIVNIPVIYLNYGFTKFLNLMEGKQYFAWLLGTILGAMMAVDLGGPINKAAYVFGTTSLTSASAINNASISMAASMAGGMTPPIAIALSCTFFKKYWTKDERNAGMLNYVMGLTFISEGAIPFTAAKPKLLVPANVVSGAVAGLIIGALSVRISAPHGGILTIALSRSYIGGIDGGLSIGLGIIFFVVAIISGSIAGMLIIWFLSVIYGKNKNEYGNSSSEKNAETTEMKTSIKKPFDFFKKQKIKETKIIDMGNKYDLHNNIFAFNRLYN